MFNHKAAPALSMVAAFFLVPLLHCASDSGKFRITSFDNGKVIKPGYEFTFQDIMHPDLDYLRKMENLDAVVENTNSEFDLIKRLVAWTASQWMHGGAGGGKHGTETISMIRQGISGGTACGGFSVLLADALFSYGIQSRFLGIASGPVIDPQTGKTNYYGHAVNDVWSNDYGKWVFMDGNFDLYFENTNGIPMSFLELQNELLTGASNNVRIVYCGDYAVSAAPLRMQHQNFRENWLPVSYGQLRLFYMVNVLAANNIHDPEWESSRKGPNGERLGPARIYYQPDISGYEPFYYDHAHYDITHDPVDVDWTLYDCEIDLQHDGEFLQANPATLTIRAFAPFIDCFLLSLNGTAWKEYPPSETAKHEAKLHFNWDLVPGLNVLKVRVRNQRGREGMVRTLAVSDDPFSVHPEYVGTTGGGDGSFFSETEKTFYATLSNSSIFPVGNIKGRIDLKDKAGAPVRFTKFCMDSEGNIIVAAGQTICVFDSDGKMLSQFGAGGNGTGQFTNIGGIAVDDKGQIHVSDADLYRVARIQVFDQKGKHLRTIGKHGNGKGEFNLPAGLATGSDGSVYVADAGNCRIQVLDEQGNCKRIIGPLIQGYGSLRFPSGLCVARHDGRDLIYVADTFNHKIVVLDTNGKLVGWFGGYTHAFNSSKGMLLQPRNVAASGNTVLVDRLRFEYPNLNR